MNETVMIDIEADDPRTHAGNMIRLEREIGRLRDRIIVMKSSVVSVPSSMFDSQFNFPVYEQPEFGYNDPVQAYERTGDFAVKKKAMKAKTHNRARGVLGPKKSRYM